MSSLVALVEGEVARQGFARKQQPFWRRLASIAHASLIEREITAAKLEFAGISEWALKSGGAMYYLQTLVDARQEPRWFPDSVSPQQLKAEFVSRIANAGDDGARTSVKVCARFCGESILRPSRSREPFLQVTCRDRLKAEQKQRLKCQRSSKPASELVSKARNYRRSHSSGWSILR